MLSSPHKLRIKIIAHTGADPAQAFPAEIHIEILRFCDIVTLAKACRVSRLWHARATPLLCESISLPTLLSYYWTTESFCTITKSLVERDRARFIQDLTVSFMIRATDCMSAQSDPYEHELSYSQGEALWALIPVIQRATNLRSLSITSKHLPMVEFWEAVSQLPALEVLRATIYDENPESQKYRGKINVNTSPQAFPRLRTACIGELSTCEEENNVELVTEFREAARNLEDLAVYWNLDESSEGLLHDLDNFLTMRLFEDIFIKSGEDTVCKPLTAFEYWYGCVPFAATAGYDFSAEFKHLKKLAIVRCKTSDDEDVPRDASFLGAFQDRFPNLEELTVIDDRHHLEEGHSALKMLRDYRPPLRDLRLMIDEHDGEELFDIVMQLGDTLEVLVLMNGLPTQVENAYDFDDNMPLSRMPVDAFVERLPKLKELAFCMPIHVRHWIRLCKGFARLPRLESLSIMNIYSKEEPLHIPEDWMVQWNYRASNDCGPPTYPEDDLLDEYDDLNDEPRDKLEKEEDADHHDPDAELLRKAFNTIIGENKDDDNILWEIYKDKDKNERLKLLASRNINNVMEAVLEQFLKQGNYSLKRIAVNYAVGTIRNRAGVLRVERDWEKTYRDALDPRACTPEEFESVHGTWKP